MSARATGWTWEVVPVSRPDLTPRAHHLLLCLADRYNDKRGYAWPSYEDITARTHIPRSNVPKYLDELRSAGLVRTEPRLSSAGRKIGTLYFLLIPADFKLSSTRGKPPAMARGDRKILRGGRVVFDPEEIPDYGVEEWMYRA